MVDNIRYLPFTKAHYELAKIYTPSMQFHKTEQVFPVDPATYLMGATLFHYLAKRREHEALQKDTPLSVLRLIPNSDGRRTYYIAPKDIGAVRAQASDIQALKNVPAYVTLNAVPGNEHEAVLTYWFLFAYISKKYKIRDLKFRYINVVLDSASLEAKRVYFSHTNYNHGTWVDASDIVTFNKTHPIVHVSLSTHNFSNRPGYTMDLYRETYHGTNRWIPQPYVLRLQQDDTTWDVSTDDGRSFWFVFRGAWHKKNGLTSPYNYACLQLLESTDHSIWHSDNAVTSLIPVITAYATLVVLFLWLVYQFHRLHRISKRIKRLA